MSRILGMTCVAGLLLFWSAPTMAEPAFTPCGEEGQPACTGSGCQPGYLKTGRDQCTLDRSTWTKVPLDMTRTNADLKCGGTNKLSCWQRDDQTRDHLSMNPNELGFVQELGPFPHNPPPPINGRFIYVYRTTDNKIMIRRYDRAHTDNDLREFPCLDYARYRFAGNMRKDENGKDVYYHVRHSQLNGGWAPVWCAGEMRFVDGKIDAINNESGHFKPPAECVQHVMTTLSDYGYQFTRYTYNYGDFKGNSAKESSCPPPPVEPVGPDDHDEPMGDFGPDSEPFPGEWMFGTATGGNELLGQWTFNPGVEKKDISGHWGDLELHGASTANGALVVSAAPTYATATGYNGPPIMDKTLVSWLTLDDIDAKGGSALTLDTNDNFDGLVYNEQAFKPLVRHKWMAGSGAYQRTQLPTPGFAEAVQGQAIQVAISYEADGRGGQTVRLCQNGLEVGSYVTDKPLGYFGNALRVMFGKRHPAAQLTDSGLAAHIREARIYGGAMRCADVASLKPEPEPLLGQWTFNPGVERRDLTGHWGDLELHDGAGIQNGALVVSAGPTYAMATGYNGPPITDKTLVSWLMFDDLDVMGGSALTLDTNDNFDGLVYSETAFNALVKHKWMAGSAAYQRTQLPSPGFADAVLAKPIQIAISYQAAPGGQRIRLCQNGQEVGSYVTDAPLSFGGNGLRVMFGKRHPAASILGSSLAAHIQEARLYAGALSCADAWAIDPEVERPRPPAPAPDPSFALVTKNGLCLDADGADYAAKKNGGKVQLWTCNDARTQRWTLEGRLLKSSNGQCLDVDFADYDAKKNGGHIQLWECLGGLNQLWKISAGMLQSSNGQCAEGTPTTYYDRRNGAPVAMGTCKPGDSDDLWNAR